MSKKFFTLPNIISVVIISSLSAGVLWVFADWSAPPTASPNCPASEPGCNLPLNVSGAGQIKAGGLTLGANLNPSDTGLIVLNGNVGIGTASPGQKLTVAGIVESASGGIKFPDGTIQTSAATAGTNYWALSGSSLYPNQTSYNVGIGTTAPGQKLTVAGIVESTGGFKFPDATTQTTAFLGNANTVGYKSVGTTVIYVCPAIHDTCQAAGAASSCKGQLTTISTCSALQFTGHPYFGLVCGSAPRNCTVAGYLLAP